MNSDLTAEIAIVKKRLDMLSAECDELCEDGDRDALSIYERVAWQREQARDEYVNLLAKEQQTRAVTNTDEPMPTSYRVWRMTNPVIDSELRETLRPLGAIVTVATHLALGGYYESVVAVPHHQRQTVVRLFTDAGLGWSAGA